ncbi:MAG: UvrD-helicase domain-containing protein [Pirellulaceae bacterium]
MGGASVVELLEGLTTAQQEAVQHVDGPLLMLAGPGSGKTRVVTHRIAYLLHQGISPRNILALTFTNKAADEMRIRLERLAGHPAVWMGTFHGFSARLLRRYASLVGLAENYSILDAGDSRKAFKQALVDSKVELTYCSPESVATAISWAKSSLISPEDYQARPGNPTGAIVEEVYPHYQRALRASNAVDFDDLLMYTAQLLRDNAELRQELDERYRYIMVDEYQDTNMAQYAIIRALSQDVPNLAVTGDPDQSIYGWRGADLSNILEFERDFPSVQVVRLEQNYRSTPNILQVADALISHNVNRKRKTLFTDNAAGRPVRLIVFPDSRDEADSIAASILGEVSQGRRNFRDFAIFYRINALSRSLEFALRNLEIPYQIVHGLEFYQRKEVKDILAYLFLLHNPQHDVAFLRIINTPRRGIGKKSIQLLQQHAQRHGLCLLEAAREAGLIESLAKRSAVAIAKFVAVYDTLTVEPADQLENLITTVIDRTRYAAHLEKSAAEEDQERLANIEELVTAAQEFDQHHPEENRLQRFLEQASLVSDTDGWESDPDQVTLMTLHAAKGLEFPVVFIVALEQGMIPHERSQEDPDQLEEERRLLFVGITRAEAELQLSLAQRRMFRGTERLVVPSEFLMEMPREEMETVQPMEPLGDSRWEDEDDFIDAIPGDEQYFQDNSDLTAVERRQASTDPNATRLMTAADLLNQQAEQQKSRCSPGSFRKGMLVKHPEYGPGTILKLTGTGVKRTATVKFFTAGEKKFRLLHAPLQPVQSGGDEEGPDDTEMA